MDSGEQHYLTEIERLAKAVCEQAAAEAWLTYLPEDAHQTPLQRSINELARTLRYTHKHDDGCLH